MLIFRASRCALAFSGNERKPRAQLAPINIRTIIEMVDYDILNKLTGNIRFSVIASIKSGRSLSDNI